MRRYKGAVQVVACLGTFGFLLHPGRFSCSNYEIIEDTDIHKSLVKDITINQVKDENHDYTNCSSSVIYPKTVLQDIIGAKNLGLDEDIPDLPMFPPHSCPPKYTSYIVVPYRDREAHLQIFLAFFHRFLQAQHLNYMIVIVEQSRKKSFNRAKLFNIGFAEVTASDPTAPCFIFHDVDLIPMNLNNMYACTNRPRHMSVSLDKFRYNLPYPELFGGAIAILADQFKMVNGFSNRFFGWGGEDDDFSTRIRNDGIPPIRFSGDTSRYVMLDHVQNDPTKDRYERVLLAQKKADNDGLNSLDYTVISSKKTVKYVHLVVDI